jgi:hypothetical protein
MTESDPEPADATIPPPPSLVCPQCGTTLDPAIATGPVAECPSCRCQFFVPSSEDAVGGPSPDDANEASGEQGDAETELSELHIRQLIILRRSAFRTRTYLFVGTCGCLFITIQLLILAGQNIYRNHHVGRFDISFFFFAIAAFMGAVPLGKKTLALHRQIQADDRARAAAEAEADKNPPDLSTLSDGSQHARNLERMASEVGPEEAGELNTETRRH